MSKVFHGTGVALITPMSNGEVDFDALSNVIEHVIGGGVDYLVPLGTTGEAVTLTTEECQRVIRFTIECTKGRVPIVGGLFGSNNTARLQRYIRDFDLTGLDAILSSCPSYVKPSQEGLYQHYLAISEVSPLPIILYNVPSRTGVNLLPTTVMRLIEQDRKFVAIKEATGDFSQIEKLTKNTPDSFQVLTGDDPTALPSMAIGCKGVISVIANAYPQIFSHMSHLALAGEYEKALVEHQKLQEIHPWLYVEGNPVGIKAAMQHLGFCTREVRLPLAAMSNTNAEQLFAAMDQVNT